MAVNSVVPDHARWHDLECGRYTEDLGAWLELAARVPGRVLDLGCGTGRTTLALAHAGHEVTAVDVDEVLLRVLAERAADLPVRCVRADVRDLGSLAGERWPLIVMPMQTIQLLDSPDSRRQMFGEVRRHLEDDGLFAAAIVTRFETFDARMGLPSPDIESYDGTLYLSRPTAVRVEGEAIAVERERWLVRPGSPPEGLGEDTVHLQSVSAAQLAAEAQSSALEPLELIPVAETGEHVANEIVVMHAR